MPGLVGIASNDNIDKKLLSKMINSLNHDNYYKINKYQNSTIGIGRVHLGIYNSEPQPFFNKNKTLCLFIDGKIYGYEDELKVLEKKGYSFDKKSDAEFCLHSYEEYGIEFIKKLNGAFVIIICDLKENKLIIANDRFGLRPLNYTINNGGLLFSPEIATFFEDKSLKKKLNDSSIINFFAFGKLLGNDTFFKGIEILPPASLLTYKDGKTSIKQYWKLTYKPNYVKSDDEFVNELEEAVRKAVKIRLDDNLKYGIALSGGLDSRCIIAATPKERRKDLTAYPHGPITCDDVKISTIVAKKTGLYYNVLPITTEMVMGQENEGVIRADGSLYFGYNFFPKISRIMREHKSEVIFTGFGFDTFLTNPWATKDVFRHKKNEQFLNLMFKKFRFFSDQELSELFVKDFYDKVKDIPLKYFTNEYSKIDNKHPADIYDSLDHLIHIIRYQFRAINLLGSGVEIAIPGYDYEIVDIALTIPPEKRFHYHIYRKLLKKLSPELMKITYNKPMVSPSLPYIFWRAGILYQKGKNNLKRQLYRFSKGKFSFPDKRSYTNWDELFRTNKKWIDFYKNLLLNGNSRLKKYINQDYVKKIFKQHQEGKSVNSEKILFLATFELVLRTYMKDMGEN